ncbi:MAG: class I SAM-dependent methyltransferase [Deltaproteobacteria bacterium]|nr:class I SAM-dependent methyltransferase [Deltaproteobacteria bacterium]
MARLTPMGRDTLRVPERKKVYNELHFSEAAPRYDTATRAMSLFRDAAWKTHLVGALPEISRPLCVDIACGTGDVSFLLAQRYPEGRIVGLDIAEPMLGIARERNRHPNLHFLRQDMCAMEFPEGSVDIVTGSYALRNAPDPPHTIGEIRRILKPGGTAAFLDFSKPRAAIFRIPQYLLLRTWCGSWGLILHGNHEIHGYIAASLESFPDRGNLLDLFAESGFSLVLAKRFFLGITELLVFRQMPR